MSKRLSSFVDPIASTFPTPRKIIKQQATSDDDRDESEDHEQKQMQSDICFEEELIEYVHHDDSNVTNDLQTKLGVWGSENNITLRSFNKLLTILQDYHPNLPKSGTSITTYKRTGQPVTEIEGIEIGIENLTDAVTTSLKNQRTILKQLVILKTQTQQRCRSNGHMLGQAQLSPLPVTGEDGISVIRIEHELMLPCKTAQQFLQLDDKCNTDVATENKLKLLLTSSNEWEMKRFVNKNLSVLLDDSVATSFSWFGANGNIPLKDSFILRTLGELTQARFTQYPEDHVRAVLKKWFHLAKDRVRKKVKNKNNSGSNVPIATAVASIAELLADDDDPDYEDE